MKTNKITLGILLAIIIIAPAMAYNFDDDEVNLVVYSGINLTNFTQLSDTPANYAGLSGYGLTVNTGENALQFTSLGTLYYPISSNPLIYWNSTHSTFNKTYADTLYYDIDNNVLSYWNSTHADFNKTYADVLYYDIDNNVLSYYNSTTLTTNLQVLNGANYWNSTHATFNKTYASTLYKDIGITTWNETFSLFNKTYADTVYIEQANEGTLNVNSSDYWDTYNNPTEIKSGDSDLLDGYDSTFFAPLNTTMIGDFNFTGRVNFDGLWSEGGLTIEGGDMYAQTIYVYNITGLNVDTLLINGSLLPQPDFTNTFNIGNSTLNWKDLYLGGQVFSNGTNDNYFLGNVGIGTTSPSTILHLNDSSSPYLRIESSTAGDANTLYKNTGGQYATGISGTNYRIHNDAGTTYMLIQSSGNVGIGTTAPVSKLDVRGVDSATAGQISISDGSGTTGRGLTLTSPSSSLSYAAIGLNAEASGDLRLGTNTYPDLIHLENSDGNVGIGTTSPDLPLSVAGNLIVGQDVTTGFSVLYVGESSTADEGLAISYDHANNLARLNINGDASPNGIVLANGGNVGIGTASPSEKLHINGTGNRNILVETSDAGYASSIQMKNNAGNAIFGQQGSAGNELITTNGLTYSTAMVSPSTQAIQLAPAGSAAMTLLSSGNVGIGTTSPKNKLNIVGATNSTTGFIMGANVGITGNYSVGTCWMAYSGGIIYGTNCSAV